MIAKVVLIVLLFVCMVQCVPTASPQAKPAASPSPTAASPRRHLKLGTRRQQIVAKCTQLIQQLQQAKPSTTNTAPKVRRLGQRKHSAATHLMLQCKILAKKQAAIATAAHHSF